MSANEWHNAHRLAHLAGGLRADNPPGDLVAFAPRLPATPPGFRLNSYHSLHSSLTDAGFQLIGVEYVTHRLQVDGQMPTDWRPHYRGQGGDLPNRAETLWSQLSAGGHDSDDFRFIDLCRRVEFQIQSASWRLHDLSNAYYRELRAAIKDEDFKHGGRGVTMNTFFIYLAVHAVLGELATLRDYLAEFVAKYVLAQFRPPHVSIRLMSALRKYVLQSCAGKHELADHLLGITGENGWLKLLSAYRDLAVHYTPIATAEHYGFVEQAHCRLNNGTEFPTVRFAMPVDPFAVKRARTEEHHFRSFKEWMRACWGSEANGPDALLYCHTALGDMSVLAFNIGGYSPIKGKMPTITPKDTIGPIIYRSS